MTQNANLLLFWAGEHANVWDVQLAVERDLGDPGRACSAASSAAMHTTFEHLRKVDM